MPQRPFRTGNRRGEEMAGLDEVTGHAVLGFITGLIVFGPGGLIAPIITFLDEDLGLLAAP